MSVVETNGKQIVRDGMAAIEMHDEYELIVIGGGPAGLSAALSAREHGLKRILIVERDVDLGGILNQCIHNGFGLHYFGEELTGPEYAAKFIDRLGGQSIDVLCDAMVLEIIPGEDGHVLRLMSVEAGYCTVRSRAIVLAMGCRERTRGAIQIPGTRAAGIFTAGTAQRYVNIEGYMVGRRVIILGSGDIGLIMARRMVLEGAKVLACVEIMPYPGGLARNIVQCLQDFDIPLYLSHTITKIEGKERVEKVTVQEVNDRFEPIEGTEKVFDVDTVLLSVGLIPENELSHVAGVEMDAKTSGPIVFENGETSIPGIFACGNVLHVHDLVDFVTTESEGAGRAAAEYVLRQEDTTHVRMCENESYISLVIDESVAYTVPQRIRVLRIDDGVRVFFRVKAPHKTPKRIVFRDGERIVASFRRPYMTPGEMEHVTLQRAELDNVSGNELLISVEEIR